MGRGGQGAQQLCYPQHSYEDDDDTVKMILRGRGA